MSYKLFKVRDVPGRSMSEKFNHVSLQVPNKDLTLAVA